MNKTIYTPPEFLMMDSGNRDQDGKLYYLYIDGITNKSEYNYDFKEKVYCCTNYLDNKNFSKQILKINSIDFPDNLHFFIDIPTPLFYKNFGLHENVILSGKKDCIIWWATFDNEYPLEIFNTNDEDLFVDEFQKTIKKSKFNLKKDDDQSFTCSIPHAKNQTIFDSYILFQKQVNMALFETDKRMTKNYIKKIQDYQKQLVNPN